MICNICGLKIEIDADGIWDGGHNAEPITEGRCCEKCPFCEFIIDDDTLGHLIENHKEDVNKVLFGDNNE